MMCTAHSWRTKSLLFAGNSMQSPDEPTMGHFKPCQQLNQTFRLVSALPAGCAVNVFRGAICSRTSCKTEWSIGRAVKNGAPLGYTLTEKGNLVIPEHKANQLYFTEWG